MALQDSLMSPPDFPTSQNLHLSNSINVTLGLSFQSMKFDEHVKPQQAKVYQEHSKHLSFLFDRTEK